MAVALSSIVWAMGRKATAFLQSLFLLPFRTLLQALDAFPGSARPRPTAPPTLPFHATLDSPHSLSSRDARFTHHGTDGGDMTVTAPSPSAAATEQRGRKAPSATMAPVPAHLQAGGPRPGPPAKENRSPQNPVSTTGAEAARLTDAFSGLQLGETGKSQAGAPQTQVRDATNGPGIAERAGGEPCNKQHQQQKTVATGGADPNELKRALADFHISEKKELATATATATTSVRVGGGETMKLRARPETAAQAAERAFHSRFMREALDMARLALKTNETPVGCVLVYRGRVIAKGMNATNVTRNGTRHAELMAISALLSYAPASDVEPAKASGANGAPTRLPLGDKTNEARPGPDEETSTWGDVDPRDGHLYPYGQKLHPSPRVDPSVITECTLYVTVEPCVMCASLLRQLGIKKVYFGAVNDKFGGTGGVFRIHKNSPYSMASAPPSPVPQNGKGIARPVLEHRPASTDVVPEEPTPVDDFPDEYNVAISHIEPCNLPGDGGNIERGYEAEGGWGRDEAVTLLRQFYVQENNRAPVPRKKEGRAARLAAMMERDGNAGAPVADPGAMSKSQGNSGTSTPNTKDSAAHVQEAQESIVQESTTQEPMAQRSAGISAS